MSCCTPSMQRRWLDTWVLAARCWLLEASRCARPSPHGQTGRPTFRGKQGCQPPHHSATSPGRDDRPRLPVQRQGDRRRPGSRGDEPSGAQRSVWPRAAAAGKDNEKLGKIRNMLERWPELHEMPFSQVLSFALHEVDAFLAPAPQ
jgi:hypothetical protein